MGIGFIILTIGSVILSIVFESFNEFRMYKDVADNGYKINMEKFMSLRKNFNSENQVSLVALFTPLVNIFMVAKNIREYNLNRPYLLNSLSNLGVLERLTETEKEKYFKNPSIFNATILHFMQAVQLEYQAISRKNNVKNNIKNKVIVINYEQGRVVYDIGQSLTDVKVLEVSGFSEKKWRNLKDIETYFKNAFLNEIKKYDDLESFVFAVNNGKCLKINMFKNNASAIFLNSWTYFCTKERNKLKESNISDEIIDLNQKINEMLFELFNNDDEHRSSMTISYPIGDIIFDIYFEKINGSLKDMSYSKQWQIISLNIKQSIFDTIKQMEQDQELRKKLNANTEFNFEYTIEDTSVCTIITTVKYNELATNLFKNSQPNNVDFVNSDVFQENEQNVELPIIAKDDSSTLSKNLRLVRKPKNR